MDYKYDDFVHDVGYGLQLAEAELKDRKNGVQGESTIGQLENYVIPDLVEFLSKIKNREKLPPNTQQDRYLTSFGYAFREWGWDMRNPSALYLQLLKIHENYKKI
jgi:hypothetical protein